MNTRDTSRQRGTSNQPAAPNRRPVAPGAGYGASNGAPAPGARQPAPVQQPRQQAPGQAAPQRPPRTTRNPGQNKRRPAATEQRKRPRRPRKPDIEKEIVYIPAPVFNRNRLLLHLGVIAAVVLAVFLSLSLFFKVKVDHKSGDSQSPVTTITVSGNQKYSVKAIVDASGIQDGDSLLAINSARISGKIITALPYVKSVRVGIKLPDTVNIEVEEMDIVYAIADENTEQTGQWWLITSDGKLVERTDSAGASSCTKLLGVAVVGGTAGQQAVALESVPETTTDATAADGTETVPQPITISAADMLDVALTILQYLEQNDILGQMVSVDVSNMGDIELWYGQRFRILMGDSSELNYKISLAIAAIGRLKDHDRGTLDVSFYNRPEVVYTPQAD